MVGRDLTDMFVRQSHEAGEVVLSVRHLTSDDVADITFDVRAGEVVGIAGLVGAGRSELAHAIVGNEPVRSGSVQVGGRTVRIRSPRDAVRAGIGFAPEERKAQALLMHRSVRDNISLAVLGRISVAHVVRRGRGTPHRRAVRRSGSRCGRRRSNTRWRNLSGGNQQKVVLARWLARRPQVLILDEPTRGVDVGAKAEIYHVINELAGEGIAIVVISSELPEILALADRVLVMQAGRITGELARSEATEERILALAMREDAVTTGAAS